MKNIKDWRPTKYIYKEGEWLPNPEHVGERYSFFAATLQIRAYQVVIKNFASGKLLDCGAGTVPYYGIYKDLVDDITCIDWGDSFHELKHIDKKVDLTGKLPFKDNTFNTVLLADVIEHLPNPENIFSEIARVLKRNGIALIFVPFIYGIHEGPYDYHRYTEFALKRYAEHNGFTVEHLKPYGGGPDVLIDMGNKMFNRSPVMYRLHSILWGILKRIGIYKRYRDRFATRFPFGYSLALRKI